MQQRRLTRLPLKISAWCLNQPKSPRHMGLRYPRPMNSRHAPLVLLALAGCASATVAAAPSAPIGTVPRASIPAPEQPSPEPAAARSATPPPSFAAEYRRLLEQMVAVDTSHGGETKLLEPIAALYREAGVPVQILESAPGRGNLVARLNGSGAKRPMLLLAHVDVVPVEGQPWSVPPFAMTEKDGFFWGRGINDDKSMAAAIVALTLELARSHAPLTRDVIVALTAGEETGGSAGARWLAENHKELLDAEIALNEGGGALVADDFSKVVSVYVGVSEKVFQTFELVVKGPGGHSSRPPTSGDPVVALARALVKVGEYRFAANVLPETKTSFASEVSSAEPAYRAALLGAVRSAPRISAADDAVLSKDPGYNAELRTTCVTTMLKGSPQDNVLPTTAEATINCRILPGDTRAHVRAALVKVIADSNVAVIDGPALGDAPASPFEGEVVEAVKKVVATTFPGASVVPGMSTGATDSRHLRAIGVRAYGVSPGMFTRAESKSGHLAHGPDERQSSKWLAPAGDYFREIVRTLAL
jgi:acetylornithine deacetylase/succinyl-diaminopimelate desuccinylase-like protein